MMLGKQAEADEILHDVSRSSEPANNYPLQVSYLARRGSFDRGDDVADHGWLRQHDQTTGTSRCSAISGL